MLNYKSYEFNEFNVRKIQNIFVLLNKNGRNLISLFLVIVILIMSRTLLIYLFHLFSMSVINKKKENYIAYLHIFSERLRSGRRDRPYPGKVCLRLLLVLPKSAFLSKVNSF